MEVWGGGIWYKKDRSPSGKDNDRVGWVTEWEGAQVDSAALESTPPIQENKKNMLVRVLSTIF